MTTFNDWIEKVWRRVYSGSADSTVQLSNDIGASDTTISVTPNTSNAMRSGLASPSTSRFCTLSLGIPTPAMQA